MSIVLYRLRERTGPHCEAMGKVRGTRSKCPHLPVAFRNGSLLLVLRRRRHNCSFKLRLPLLPEGLDAVLQFGASGYGKAS